MEINPARLFDDKAVRDFRRLFHQITGLYTSFWFPAWRRQVDFIPSKAQCRFCKMVQTAPRNRQMCLATDEEFAQTASKAGKLIVRPCWLGLTSIAVPVHLQGKYIGLVFAGEALAKEPTPQQFAAIRKRLKDADLDYTDLESAYREIPVLPRPKLKVCVELLSFMVNYIIDKEQNAQLQEAIYQRQQEISGIMAGRLTLESDLEKRIDEVQRLRAQLQAVESAVRIAEISDDPSAKYSRVTSKALEFIDSCYMEHITLADVAQQVNLSPSHLSRTFHRDCGCTFIEYLIRRRITRACELLQDPRFNISEISLMVGYDNPRHFTQLFKKTIGLPPSEYRNRG